MAEHQKDGGPAFPETRYCEEGGRTIPFDTTPGMSLRDWFAGQALVGLLSKVGPYGSTMSYDEVAKHFATYSFVCADAMLAERSKAEGQQ